MQISMNQLLILASTLFFLTGCGQNVVQPGQPGAYCDVQFRGDVLSAGRTLSISGTFLKLTEEYLVIRDHDDEVWIPLNNILKFSISKPKQHQPIVEIRLPVKDDPN